jgi:hypothetical protein
MTCTEPQHWPALPGPDAADNEIEAFIEHTEVCRFHARLLRDEEELLRCDVTYARSVHPEGKILLTAEDSDLVERQRKQLLDWSEAPSQINRLLVRVPGKTVAALDLSRAAELNFEVRAAPFFQVWKAGRRKRPEVLLATYPLQGFAHSGRRSHVPLANGGFLSFSVHEVAPSQFKCQLTCMQPATVAASASAQGRGRDWQWQHVLLGGACFVLLLFLTGVSTLYYLRSRQVPADKEAIEERKQESGPEVAKLEDHQPPPTDSQELHGEPPLRDRGKVGARVSKEVRPGYERGRKPPTRDTQVPHSATPHRSAQVGKPVVSYSEVRSVYLDPAPAGFPQRLHDELSKQIASNGFTVEPSREKADARLRIITLAPGSWTFRLVNDSGHGILVSTVRVDAEKQEEVKRAVRQVVEALRQVTSTPSVAQ